MSSNSDYREEIPRCLLDQLLYVERIALHRKYSVLVLITKSYRMLEVKERAILSTIDLEKFLHKHESTSVYSFFGTISPDENPALAGKNEVSLAVFRSNDGIERKIFYLVSIDHKLVIVERKDQPAVKYVHIETYERYIKHEITGREDCPGLPVVKIYVEYQLDPIVTDFQSYKTEGTENCVNNFTCFEDTLKTLREQTNKSRAELATIRSTTGELFERLNDRFKQVPGLLRTENPDEKRPLVKYGDVWIKVHNEQLVLGIPIFNCTYKRRLTLINLSLLLNNRSRNHFEYSFKFYQLQDDDFEFKNYEQILQAEDIISDVPLFQQEWGIPKINALHSEQTAVFIATMKLSSALDQREFSTVFECFVNYNVATVEQDLCDPLQLFVGNVEVTRKDLYSQRLAISFDDQRYLANDLLAVTATSEFLSLKITFLKNATYGLDRFCREELKFHQVSLPSGTDQQEPSCLFYYADSGYWQAVLIRLDEQKTSTQKIKLYARYKHQIFTFLQAIHSDYEEQCSVTLSENQTPSLLEFKESILKELKIKIDNPSATQEILSRELKTDCIYSTLKIN
ncbi:uncharacterized protein LOC129720847 [Wyeomyia smithii]|uniref:uncharacterized protein LOC129720847 n=1 Tax=Wyeomyia smithii TaxID=174621 RepID=UPI002467BB9D|nr:uncharacterized protein LOC129720847 [Wyeomyia smithii]XP_055528654.1 uncharacterized protein LOC129720847 [Wyeomyia smithii]